jgi:hypothetical protein
MESSNAVAKGVEGRGNFLYGELAEFFGDWEYGEQQYF